MPSRYASYEDAIKRADEGEQTVADLLLSIFRDMDARIALSEEQAAGAAAIERELTAYGTERIETFVAPIIASIRSAADLGALLTAPSVSALAIGTGPKTFVIGEGQRRLYAPSAMIVAVANDNPAAVMWGRRVAYDASSGELTIDVLSVTGAGTFSSWTLSTGALVEMAAQAGAAHLGAFAGATVQALLDELMTAVGGDPHFADTILQAIATAKSEAKSEALDALRDGVSPVLDTMQEIASALGQRISIAAAQSFSVAQQRQAKANMGVLGGQSLVKSTNYTVAAADNGAVVLMSASAGARTVTLPDVADVGVGFVLTIKKTDTSANVVSVAATAVDGGTSAVLALQWQAVTLVSDASGWRIISECGRPRPLSGTAAKSANYTVTGADNGGTLLVDASGAARTITLPAATAVPSSFTICVKKADATINTVTISGTIDGATNIILRRPQQVVLLLSDGAAWSLVTEAADQPPLTRFAAKTANYTVVLTDEGATVSMDASAAARTITLPSATAVPVGFAVTLRKGDTSINAVSVAGTIDGLTNYVLVSSQQAVTVVSDGAAWMTLGTSREALRISKFAAKTANYTVVAGDNQALLSIDCAGANRTVTLPAANAVPEGFTINLKKIDTTFNYVTIAATVDGVANPTIRLPQQSATIVSDGTSWMLLAECNTIFYGSGVNGSYERHANGWQVCMSPGFSLDATTAAGSIFKTGSAVATWTFPAEFVSNPITAAVVTGNAETHWATARALGTTSAVLHAFAPASSTSRGVQATATGRWY